MPRQPRFAPPNYALHITQRGNYRQPVFFTDDDRNRFLTMVNEHADDRRVLVHGYALMSNHIHPRLRHTAALPQRCRSASS